MPDYLSCGACHAEFEVVDFYLFLNHKLSSCNVNYPKNGSNRLSGVDSVLECSKCLRKCRTPWALLQHLQTEHCLSLARTLLLPTNGPPAPFLLGRRQRSLVDENNMTEACTQTTRSCLKRQVCPYEEGLPDDCCLKASKEQRASDSGCCCMDSFGSDGRGGGGCSGACSGGGAGGDGKAAKRQSDCCLAVPKKRRLLTAAAADGSVEGERPDPQATIKSPPNATAAVDSSDIPDGCCGLQPDCVLLRPPVEKRSAECQTDFVVSLLDDLDVDMLLEDAGVDVPTSLVSQIDGECGGASIASINSSSSTMDQLSTSLSSMHRLAPAPSKAIQTVSRIASQQHLLAQPPPAPAQQQQVVLADFYSADALRYQQSAEEELTSRLQQRQHLQPSAATASVSMSVTPVIFNVTGSSVDLCSQPSRQQASTSYSQSQLSAFDSRSSASAKELRFKCNLCPRTFRQNIHLRKHIMSQHSHSKPHKCPSCDYTTVEKSHLTVHIRKHTGERPFSCRVCDYSTAQNCTLKAHYLRKHPGNIVHCAKCNLEFVTEHERDKHERGCSLDLLAVQPAAGTVG